MPQESYISKFKPASCFFTEPTAIAQSQGLAFGPKSAEVYDLTARFISTGAKAYAICKGAVLIQPQDGDADRVNLILRPYTQPISGFNIKYFIYRGLKIDDFFVGDNVLPIGTETSDFIRKINESFDSFYVSTDQVKPTFEAKFIGYDPDKPDDLLLDEFFFKQSEYVVSAGEFEEDGEMAFELPLIYEGASLGYFGHGECGMDVVLSYGDYHLPRPNSEFPFDLAYARSAYAQITLTGITDEFRKKLLREQIFQFLDIAAFYGFHAVNGIVSLKSMGTTVNKKGEAIYTDLLLNFHTKNKLYLYIQSDRTRSYNFYGNYAISDSNLNNLKIGITENNLSEISYGTLGWPLIIHDEVQNHLNSQNSLFLQFVTDYNVNTMLYGQVANIVNAQHNNFCNADNLALPNNPDGTLVGLTKIIALANPAVGPNNAKMNIASFNIILYEGKSYDFSLGTVNNGNQAVDATAFPNSLDDVFDLVEALPLLKNENINSYSILSSQKIRLTNQSFENIQKGISAIQTIVVLDVVSSIEVNGVAVQRVSYISETVDILNDQTNVLNSVVLDTKSSVSVSGNVVNEMTYSLPSPYKYVLNEFKDGIKTINGVRLISSRGEVFNKFIIGITEDENQRLRLICSSNSINNPRIILQPYLKEDNEEPKSDLFSKYRLGLAAENMIGKLILFMPIEEIIIYSLDGNYYFSKDYSKDMVLEVDGVNGDINYEDLIIV